GKHGARATAGWLDGDVTCHVLDIYDRHAIEKTHHVKAVCSPHLPEGEWDRILLRTGPKLMSGELALDLLQECRRVAGPGREDAVEVDFVGRERDRNDLVSKVFGKDARERSFAAKYTASVPGAKPISLVSYPGCFCHRRTDEGGLALAETAVRLLREDAAASAASAGGEGASAASGEGSRALRLLDMGCGNGLVAFLVASAVDGVAPVLVDSHSRAVEAARENAAALGIDAEIILADNGTPQRLDGTFDVFVGNPPYYSEYRIAEVFCETARRALKPGGLCLLVCKNEAGLRPVVANYFDAIETIPRRGYAVLRAVKGG
ncbi:MAG: methyltransferase, partial [Kiritimatiellae bacterium]|nr:methyltransferase [Kiritimatiellia bacterium]